MSIQIIWMSSFLVFRVLGLLVNVFTFIVLHSLPMLADETNFGLVLYNQASFYQFEETSSYWSVKQISVFLCFSLVNQWHTSGITVYNQQWPISETLCGPCIAGLSKQTMLTLTRHLIPWHLNWVCTVCICPQNGFPILKGLMGFHLERITVFIWL